MSTFLASIQILKKAYSDLVGVILLDGQPAYDETNNVLRIGDGSTAFESLPSIKPIKYKVYTALLTQTSTSAPTAIVLENTLSGTPTFTYVDPGEYTLTLTGEFVVDKTVVTYNLIAVDNLDDAYVANRASANVIDIKTYDSGTLADGILNKSFLEIRIYE